jgi:hypothetical protein
VWWRSVGVCDGLLGRRERELGAGTVVVFVVELVLGARTDDKEAE